MCAVSRPGLSGGVMPVEIARRSHASAKPSRSSARRTGSLPWMSSDSPFVAHIRQHRTAQFRRLRGEDLKRQVGPKRRHAVIVALRGSRQCRGITDRVQVARINRDRKPRSNASFGCSAAKISMWSWPAPDVPEARSRRPRGVRAGPPNPQPRMPGEAPAEGVRPSRTGSFYALARSRTL
jgi:hypothetical protein